MRLKDWSLKALIEMSKIGTIERFITEPSHEVTFLNACRCVYLICYCMSVLLYLTTLDKTSKIMIK